MASTELNSNLVECHDCCIENCKSLQRLQQISNWYEQWLYDEANKYENCLTNLLYQSCKSYSIKTIINDYQHIKQKKYNMSLNNILCPQSSSKCMPLQRYKRDNYQNYDKIYYTKDIKQIIIQKLLDEIHLFLYHPLSNNKDIDIDHNQRFCTKQQHINIDQNEQEKEEKIVQSQQEEEEEEEEEKKVFNIKGDIDAYNFGKQFFYWDYYKNDAWFISKKYDNLKQELLENDLCKIDIIVWNIEHENALNKLENDERVKALRSNNEFKDKYKIQQNIKITMDHLLSILFYCNTDELQSIFSSTYRPNINESDETLKNRHCNYFHFGKLLRETVEVFGMVWVDIDVDVDDEDDYKQNPKSLYHGIDHPLYFTKMIAKFYSPTSTSKNRAIAAQFAGNDGMILEIGKYERKAFYFDCFLSGYGQEEEYLFIGGYAALKIKNILHFSNNKTDDIESYSQYLQLMQCFFSILSNKNIDEQTLSILPHRNNILNELINNEIHNINGITLIPHYISNLFHFRCGKIDELEIDLIHFIQISKILNIQYQCMDNKNIMININLMIQLFPNLQRIKIILEKDFKFTTEIVQFLYKNLAKKSIRSSDIFESVEFCFYVILVPFDVRSQIINQLQADFDNIGWIISIQQNVDQNGESVYFSKIVANINPCYRPISDAFNIQYSYPQNIEDQLKQPILQHESKQNEPIRFHDIIPYRKKTIDQDKLTQIYPFLTNNYAQSSKSFILAIWISIMCTLQTIIQIWFISSGPAPYRWISLGFFILTQLLSMILLYGGCIFFHEMPIIAPDITEIQRKSILFAVLLSIAFPIIPVINVIFVQWLDHKKQRYKYKDTIIEPEWADFVRSTLWVKCASIIPITMFQTYPQLIILVVMFANYEYQLSTDPMQVINWSFISSILVLLSFCVVFTSIFEDLYLYLFNTIWLYLDYTIFLFILSAVFYDDIGLMLGVIYLIITSLPWLVLPITFTKIIYKDNEDETVGLQFIVMILMLCCFAMCCDILFLPLFIFIFAPWSMVMLTIIDQISHCNISPFCLNIFNMKYDEKWISYWYRYRLYKWIKSGIDREEKDTRLCCVNMIILDKYYKDDFYKLKQNMTKVMRGDTYFGTKAIKTTAASNHSKYALNLGTESNDNETYMFIAPTMRTYVISRFIHIIMPIIISIYILYREMWIIDNVNFIIKYLGYTVATLYVCCIVCLVCTWKSMYYHRMMIPFIRADIKINDDFTNIVGDIAECHAIVTITRILTDTIGHQDIVDIIMHYIL